MTRLEMRNLTLSWLDDINAGYFPIDLVNLWLNNAQKEAQKRLLQAGENWYVKRVCTTTILNQFDYILPTDFLKLHRLEYIVSGTAPNEEVSVIEPITINQQDMFPNAAGTPGGYYLKKNVMVLLPPPDSAKQLRLWYSYLVADMSSDGQQPDVPVQYHEFLPCLAFKDGLLKDGRDIGPATEKIAYYENLMREDAESRREDQPRMIVVTQSDGIEALF